jgi:hypothetical protein
MNEYSPETRVDLTWSGWLLIAPNHYELASKNCNAGTTAPACAVCRSKSHKESDESLSERKEVW